MEVIYVLLPLALAAATAAVIAFVWAVRSGQFDDMETPGLRAVYDDEPVRETIADEEGGPDDGASRVEPPA